jgi:hypothetical protein
MLIGLGCAAAAAACVASGTTTGPGVEDTESEMVEDGATADRACGIGIVGRAFEDDPATAEAATALDSAKLLGERLDAINVAAGAPAAAALDTAGAAAGAALCAGAPAAGTPVEMRGSVVSALDGPAALAGLAAAGAGAATAALDTADAETAAALETDAAGAGAALCAPAAGGPCETILAVVKVEAPGICIDDAAGGFMAAMLGMDPEPAMTLENEPAAQRHWQSHWPFACVTPVPEATAPGAPTACDWTAIG